MPLEKRKGRSMLERALAGGASGLEKQLILQQVLADGESDGGGGGTGGGTFTGFQLPSFELPEANPLVPPTTGEINVTPPSQLGFQGSGQGPEGGVGEMISALFRTNPPSQSGFQGFGQGPEGGVGFGSGLLKSDLLKYILALTSPRSST
jgi:hypothetical protein